MFNNLLYRLVDGLSRGEEVEVNSSNCLLNYNRFLSCNKCSKACPAEIIELDEGSVNIDRESCVLCGRCIASCPASVFDFAINSDLDLLETLLDKRDREQLVVTCRKVASGSIEYKQDGVVVVPCLLRLYDLLLISAAVFQVRFELTLDECLSMDCSFNNQVEVFLNQQLERAEEIIPGTGDYISLKEKRNIERNLVSGEEHLSRRRLFSLIKHGTTDLQHKTIGLTRDLLDDISGNKDQYSLLRRNLITYLLLSDLKESDPEKYQSITSLPFKVVQINDRCDYCLKCSKICPSGALSTREGVFYYNSIHCLGCKACHNICDQEAISFEDQIEVSSFVDRERKKIIELELKPCQDCGEDFSPTELDGEFCFICRHKRERKKQREQYSQGNIS